LAGTSHRLALAALGLALTAGASACDEDPKGPCGEAYQHLVTLARRNPEPEDEASFIAACVAAWDKKRVACLTAAKSVGDALACKPVKKRPG